MRRSSYRRLRRTVYHYLNQQEKNQKKEAPANSQNLSYENSSNTPHTVYWSIVGLVFLIFAIIKSTKYDMGLFWGSVLALIICLPIAFILYIPYCSIINSINFKMKTKTENHSKSMGNKNLDEQPMETRQETGSEQDISIDSENDADLEPYEEVPKWRKAFSIIIIIVSIVVCVGLLFLCYHMHMKHAEEEENKHNYNPCDKNGHVYEWIKEKETTCYDYGYIEFHCMVCDQTLKKDGTLTKLSHNYQDNICTLCGDSEYMFYIYDDQMWSSGNYYYFSGYVRNDDYRYHDFVEIKVKLYDENERVFDSDWTYAVGSEGFYPGESKYFEMMVRKTSKYCEYYSFSIIDYD